jgi:hypothetical protein
MEPRAYRDQLDPTSRLNYTKIYTVEYNVKVSFIGKIHRDSVRDFVRDFNETHTLILDAEFSDPVQGEKSLLSQESTRTKTAIDKKREDSQDTWGKLKKTRDNGNRTNAIARTSPDTGLLPEKVHFAQESRIESKFKLSSSSVGSDDADSISIQSDMATSATSVDPDPLTELLTLFCEDQRLSVLFSEASRTILPARFEQKMRLLLLKFAKNLRAEARSNIEKEASRVIKYQSRNIASSLGKRIYPVRALELDDPRFYQPLELEKWIETVELGKLDTDLASTSEQEDNEDMPEVDGEKENGEGGEKTGKLSNLQLHLLDAFIKPSKSLSFLADDFSLFLKKSKSTFHTPQENTLREDCDWTIKGLSDPDFRTARRALFDPIHKAISKSWPESEGYSSIVSVEYKVFWEIPRFLDTYFGKGQRLGNVLTLTGDSNEAQALPCGEYLIKHWPSISDPLLAAIEELIRTSARGYADAGNVKIEAQSTPMLGGKPSTNQRPATFTVEAAFGDHHDILSAISWICAAVRHGEREGLSVSKVYIETSPISDALPRILLKLCPLTPIDENGLCWHSLFAHTVIAYDFPISDRKKGRGLELLFQNMLMLARSLRLTEYDNGLVAEGLDNLIIPVDELEEDNGLQWHLEWKTPSSSPFDILAGDSFLSRYKTKDLQKLADSRTFLGWTGNALVTLGTKRFNSDFTVDRLKISEAPPLRDLGFRVVSHSITLGTYAIPGVAFQGQITMAQSFDGNYTATRKFDKRLCDRLQDSARRNVIITNRRGGISWYVPEASVILYMIQVYIKKRGYKVLQAENENSPVELSSLYANQQDVLPDSLYADQQSDGGQAAEKILKACMKARIFNEDESFQLKDLISKFLLELETQRQERSQVLKVARQLKKAAPGSIVGYELLHVVLETPNLLAKVIQFADHQPWTFLADEAPVLIVEDFGQAIVTNEPHVLCDRWRQVPTGRNYLVAAAPAIQHLIESRGGFKLSDQVLWDFSNSLIDSHQIGNKSPVLHTQRLCSVESRFNRWKRGQIDPRPMLNAASSGAFIFGSPVLTKPCNAIFEHTGMQMVSVPWFFDSIRPKDDAKLYSQLPFRQKIIRNERIPMQQPKKLHQKLRQ